MANNAVAQAFHFSSSISSRLSIHVAARMREILWKDNAEIRSTAVLKEVAELLGSERDLLENFNELFLDSNDGILEVWEDPQGNRVAVVVLPGGNCRTVRALGVLGQTSGQDGEGGVSRQRRFVPLPNSEQIAQNNHVRVDEEDDHTSTHECDTVKREVRSKREKNSVESESEKQVHRKKTKRKKTKNGESGDGENNVVQKRCVDESTAFMQRVQERIKAAAEAMRDDIPPVNEITTTIATTTANKSC